MTKFVIVVHVSPKYEIWGQPADFEEATVVAEELARKYPGKRFLVLEERGEVRFEPPVQTPQIIWKVQ